MDRGRRRCDSNNLYSAYLSALGFAASGSGNGEKCLSCDAVSAVVWLNRQACCCTLAFFYVVGSDPYESLPLWSWDWFFAVC